jgi:hypothetical protein
VLVFRRIYIYIYIYNIHMYVCTCVCMCVCVCVYIYIHILHGMCVSEAVGARRVKHMYGRILARKVCTVLTQLMPRVIFECETQTASAQFMHLFSLSIHFFLFKDISMHQYQYLFAVRVLNSLSAVK